MRPARRLLGRRGVVSVLSLALAAAVAAPLVAQTIIGPAPRRTGLRPPGGVATPATPAGPAAPVVPSGPTRTRAEVEALIQQAGATAPDWYESTALNYPPTLDLTWTEQKGVYNPQKFLGQYVWGVIDENPAKWREGVKLLHHCLTVNKSNQSALVKTMDALGRVYHNLFQDWARAAFWWRKAQTLVPSYAEDNASELAHCYWKLGCKEMAVSILSRYSKDDTRHGSYIKLWAELGEVTKALAMANDTARAGFPDVGYLAAGDACRLAGRFKEATDYYQKVLAGSTKSEDLKQNKARAQQSIEAIRAAEGLDLAKIRDGFYTATSMAYAGPLEVTVEVQGGKIIAVKVTKHQEKQYYTAFTDTPAQIVEKQGIRGVDAVTSATITSEAVINAAAKALAKGMQ
jgi:uncharacterized protein with FMN-binding domain